MEKLQSKAADNGIDMSVEHFLMIVLLLTEPTPGHNETASVKKILSLWQPKRPQACNFVKEEPPHRYS